MSDPRVTLGPLMLHNLDRVREESHARKLNIGLNR
jgi:hypothetical protein